MRVQSKRKVHVKGRLIGGSVPLVCLPLTARETGDLLQQAAQCAGLVPDLIEWRVDAYGRAADIAGSLQVLADLQAAIGSIPLILTCRIDAEGGLQPLDRAVRLELLRSAVRTGAVDIVDIELCNDRDFIAEVMAAAAAGGVKVILSFHDFSGTPDEAVILGKLIEAQQTGADIAKVSVMPAGCADVLVLLSATWKARSEKLEIPIVTIAMGAEGAVTRLAGGLFGSDITFAVGAAGSAPGQIPVDELRRAMRLFYPA